ncbi:MAG: coproporphyrinogen-III oxidase family protein [Acidobacteriota bacterium]
MRPAAAPSPDPPLPDGVTRRAGLYVHVPFCGAICPYCDFAVRRGGDDAKRAYVDALGREIALTRAHLDRLGARDDPPPLRDALPFDTLYLGGGTPSALDDAQLTTIVETLRAALPIADDARLFLEANPEDVTPARLAHWRALGVATLSLGSQRLDDRALAFLGRHHRGDDVRRVVDQVRAAAIDTLSLDLIYGLPDEAEADAQAAWTRELDAVGALDIDHVSAYQLAVEPGTVFGKRAARGALTPLADGAQAIAFHLTHARLAAAGLAPYEACSFARAPHHRSRHNRKYWHHVPYVGLGPSAHSFDGRVRWWNERHLPRWQRALAADAPPIADRETIDAVAGATESLLLGLRTVHGVDPATIERRWRVTLIAANRDRFAAWADAGLIARRADDRLVPTRDGLAVADGLAASCAIAPAA